MKILAFIILFFATPTLGDVDHCDTINECVNIFMKDKRGAKYLHTEIQARIPFLFLTSENCEIKNSNYILKHVRKVEEYDPRKKKTPEVRITKFKKRNNKIEMHLFYPIDGAGANCIFKIENGNIKLEEVKIYEI